MYTHGPSQHVACALLCTLLLTCLFRRSKAMNEQAQLIREAEGRSDGNLKVTQGEHLHAVPQSSSCLDSGFPKDSFEDVHHWTFDPMETQPKNCDLNHRLFQTHASAQEPQELMYLALYADDGLVRRQEARNHNQSPPFCDFLPGCIHSASQISGLEHGIGEAPMWTVLPMDIWSQDTTVGTEENESSPRELSLFPKASSVELTKGLKHDTASDECSDGTLNDMSTHDPLTELKLYSETQPIVYFDPKPYSNSSFKGALRDEKQFEARFDCSTSLVPHSSVSNSEGNETNQKVRLDEKSDVTNPKKHPFSLVEVEEVKRKKRNTRPHSNSTAKQIKTGETVRIHEEHFQVDPKDTKIDNLAGIHDPSFLQQAEKTTTKDFLYETQGICREAFTNHSSCSGVKSRYPLKAFKDGWDFVKADPVDNHQGNQEICKEALNNLDFFFNELKGMKRYGVSKDEFWIMDRDAAGFMCRYSEIKTAQKQRGEKKEDEVKKRQEDPKSLYKGYLVAFSEKAFIGTNFAENFQSFMLDLQERMLKNIPYFKLDASGKEVAWSLVAFHAEYVKELIRFSALRIRIILEVFRGDKSEKFFYDKFPDAYDTIINLVKMLETCLNFKTRDTIQLSWKIVAYWLQKNWPILSSNICKQTNGAVREDWIGFLNDIIFHANHNVSTKKFCRGFRQLALEESLSLRAKYWRKSIHTTK